MPLPHTISCFSKIQIGFTFLLQADPGSPGKGPLNGGVCVCVVCPVAVDSTHMTALSSVSWSRFSPLSNFVNGHVSTMWFVVRRWPQSHGGDGERPYLCKLAWHGPWPVRKRFIRNHVWWGRLKHGCRIVGSVTIVWLTTEADDQPFLHCVIVSTDVMSDHIGHRDASRRGGCTSRWHVLSTCYCVSKLGKILHTNCC